MKYLKKYNEGIFSKAAELLRYNKKADYLIKKYIKMIYDDYGKNKDLFRVNIIENSSHTTLNYLITTGKQNNVQLGNRDEDAITIKLTFIENTFKWSGDTTQARLEVEKFKSYLGDLTVVGRNIETGEIIENENGIKYNMSYINTPSGEVKKIIKFFIKEFKSKYPSMTKYYGPTSILQIDGEERDKVQSKYKEEKKKYEEEKEKERNFILPKLEPLKVKREDILDVFVEVEDEIDISISYEKSIFIDNKVYFWKKYDQLENAIVGEFLYSNFSLDGSLNKNKLKLNKNDINLDENVPYHKLTINLLEEDVDFNEFKNRIDKVINRLKSGFKLKLKQSAILSENGIDPSILPYPKFIKYECNSELNRMTLGFYKIYSTYIAYLSEK